MYLSFNCSSFIMKFEKTLTGIVTAILIATTPVKADENYEIRDLTAYIKRNDGNTGYNKDNAIVLEEHLQAYKNYIKKTCEDVRAGREKNRDVVELFNYPFYRNGMCLLAEGKKPKPGYEESKKELANWLEYEKNIFIEYYDINKDGRVSRDDDFDKNNKINSEDKKLYKERFAEK